MGKASESPNLLKTIGLKNLKQHFNPLHNLKKIKDKKKF